MTNKETWRDIVVCMRWIVVMKLIDIVFMITPSTPAGVRFIELTLEVIRQTIPTEDVLK